MDLHGPKVKISRALGIAITPKAARIMNRKPQPPGSAAASARGRRRKLSDYKLQLMEKQKLRAQYNISERQLVNYYARAQKGTGNTGEALVSILERRLDAVVLRSGFAPTIYAARQFVNHGHFTVNGKKVDIPSYQVKPGDLIAVKQKSRRMPAFIEASESGSSMVTYLTFDRQNLTAKFLRVPERSEVPVLCEVQTIVEYYSR
jgi:small subunit ribosomal protein S4